MQNLAGYGSDSDDEAGPSANLVPSSTSAQEGTTQQPQAQQSDHLPAASAISRVKASSSRAQSPFSGVRMANPSTSGSPKQTTTSSLDRSKRRGRSSSPPPFARAGRIEETDDSVEPETGNGPSGVQLDSLAEFGIPPIPTGPCSPSVETKLANFHHLAETRNLHFNDSLSRSKAFRNPRILGKLVEFAGVDEMCTNWPKHVWDPKGLGPDATAQRIADLQRVQSEARQAGQKVGARSSIAFASTGPSSSSTVAAGAPESRSGRDERSRTERDRERDRERYRERDRERDRDRNDTRKRSRWDAGGGAGHRSRSPLGGGGGSRRY